MSSTTNTNSIKNPTCVLCGKVCETPYGNSPEPLADEGVCCDLCNTTVVIGARFAEANADRKGKSNVFFHTHRIDGKDEESEDVPETLTHEEMEELKHRVVKALFGRKGEKFTLEWNEMELEEGETKESRDGDGYFTKEQQEMLIAGVDASYYGQVLKGDERMEQICVDGKLSTKLLIQFLASRWLLEEQEKRSVNGMGGNWSCGCYSGMWADICLRIKSQDPKRPLFVGVRILFEKEPLSMLGCLLGGKTEETFRIVQTELMAEPMEVGRTTTMCPNWGLPWECRWARWFNQFCVEQAEEAKKQRKIAKREAERAENWQRQQDEKERKALYANVEVALDEATIAYNKAVQSVKETIQFNKEHVAKPLAKRLEAKEAERLAKEAEERRQQKLAEKEAERLAKFATKSAKSSK